MQTLSPLQPTLSYPKIGNDWQFLARFRNVVASSYKTVGRVCLTFADPVRNRRARAAPLRYRSGAVPPGAKPGLTYRGGAVPPSAKPGSRVTSPRAMNRTSLLV